MFPFVPTLWPLAVIQYWTPAIYGSAQAFTAALSEGQEKGARQHAEVMAERDAREAKERR